ncbi:MAG TPA: LysR family transcriptional regulator [Cellulomonas sp.]
MRSTQQIDLQTVRIVHALAAERTITGVARSLGLSQPAVSQHIQRAEARLGVALVRKNGRYLELTQAGEVVLSSAERILGGVTDIQSGLETVSGLGADRLRLSGFPSASSTIVPQLYRRLRSQRAGLAITYTEAEPPETIELVRSGRCDLGIICTYPTEADRTAWFQQNGLRVGELFVDPFCALLPHGHSLAGLASVDLIDLGEDQWVAGCERCREHVVAACHQCGFSPQITMETDNFNAVVGFVAAGIGVSILPRMSLQTLRLPKNVVLTKSEPHTYRTVQFVHREDALGDPVMRLAVSSLLSVVGLGSTR